MKSIFLASLVGLLKSSILTQLVISKLILKMLSNQFCLRSVINNCGAAAYDWYRFSRILNPFRSALLSCEIRGYRCRISFRGRSQVISPAVSVFVTGEHFRFFSVTFLERIKKCCNGLIASRSVLPRTPQEVRAPREVLPIWGCLIFRVR